MTIERNSVRCNICGDEIESTHRHDFRSCSCGVVSVDGGHAYLRRVFVDDTDFTDTSVCTHRPPSPYNPSVCPDCGKDFR